MHAQISSKKSEQKDSTYIHFAACCRKYVSNVLELGYFSCGEQRQNLGIYFCGVYYMCVCVSMLVCYRKPRFARVNVGYNKLHIYTCQLNAMYITSGNSITRASWEDSDVGTIVYTCVCSALGGLYIWVNTKLVPFVQLYHTIAQICITTTKPSRYMFNVYMSFGFIICTFNIGNNMQRCVCVCGFVCVVFESFQVYVFIKTRQ